MDTASAAIDIRQVEQVYPNGTRALMPVSLRIEAGEFVTLLGPSGCGKSTLLRMVAGLLAPSAGQIDLAGSPVQQASQRQSALSFVFQEPTLMPWATALANVQLPLELARVPAAEAKARAQQALAQVGLAEAGGLLPRELSGGMQMRVSIARGLVTRPTWLLMDEPFAALDEITRTRLDADLRSLWRAQGLTVVFVTHSITEAVSLASRVVVMAPRPGRIVDDLAVDTAALGEDRDRTSPAFNALVRHLQQRLAQASAGTDTLGTHA
jgi:NitT/TauT family transport system ATP-binding protein